MNSGEKQNIGKRLKAARRAASLTQAEVAKDFQLSRQAVSAWECGTHLPTVGELVELCLLYGASSDFLLFGMKTVPASSKAVVQDLFRLRDPCPEKG